MMRMFAEEKWTKEKMLLRPKLQDKRNLLRRREEYI